MSIASTTMAGTIDTFLMKQEGFRSAPYKDVRQQSVGYGLSTSWAKANGWDGSDMTRWEAKNLLEARLRADRVELNRKIVKFDSLPQGVIVAVHSAYYNAPVLVGPYLRNYLNKRDYKSAGYELAYGHINYNTAAIARRIKEANLILAQVDERIDVPTSIRKFKQCKSQWKAERPTMD